MQVDTSDVHGLGALTRLQRMLPSVRFLQAATKVVRLLSRL